MTQEDQKARYDRLVNLVRLMRGYQREYFKFRLGSDLRNSKKYEALVDKFIEQEDQAKASKQTEIF